jgi:hypothetical protein
VDPTAELFRKQRFLHNLYVLYAQWIIFFYSLSTQHCFQQMGLLTKAMCYDIRVSSSGPVCSYGLCVIHFA